MSMRGLVQFIADLRNARARELEEKRINKELANIRQKFRSSDKLDGYQKKKYVCKLLYIYIQGYDVDFGHLEAVNLISATKYSEKQIGYLAVTLFLHEHHDLLHLVVNSIRKDLADHNELFNCLALHAVANVGGREMGDALAADVHRLLISPTSKAFVKKKAALTLLRLYRRHPAIVQQHSADPDWTERVIALMDDPDMGVVLSVTSLVMALVQDNPDQYRGSYVKAAQRLKRIVVDNDLSPDYFYYNVACPWIQVKFLKLLQYYPPSEDSHVRSMIRQSLSSILHAATDMPPKNVQQNNAQNAVLFEAINLLIHLDAREESERQLMIHISTRLGRFIQSRETNIRYLGLDALTHFAARAETLDPIKKHQTIILGSLRDRDISVRRKGLDLLYSMCDASNAQPIVNELMRYLHTADYSIRPEMVLKIAILTEKYATDARWYIDVSLRLLALAGDHVTEEVWQRVIQIVTNNEEVQAYAAQTILLDYLKKTEINCHDSLVRIGGYLLGEFGHLIADLRSCSPIEQLMALQNKMITSPDTTRALLLSTFVKFVNLFPEIKSQLVRMFRFYSYSPDSELQQRACEYLALVSLPTDDLLRTVCDEMPPFSERTSVLLQRLHKKSAGTSQRRTWLIGGKDANSDQAEVLLAQSPGLKRSFTTKFNGAGSPAPVSVGGSAATGSGNAATASSSAKDLAGLDLNQPTPTTTTPSTTNPVRLSPDWQTGYERLYFANEGVLYSDAQLQVGVRAEYRGHLGVVKLYFHNKSSFGIGSFTTTIDSTAGGSSTSSGGAAGGGNSRSGSGLKIDTKALPDSSIASESQTQQTIVCTATGPSTPSAFFSESPTIRISYLAGALQTYTLRLPILPHRFMDPSDLSPDDFFKRWRQIGGPGPMEAQSTFALRSSGSSSNNELDLSVMRAIVTAFRWQILENVDPNPNNVVGCAVYQMEHGKTGCLLRLEPNVAQKMFRLTIRATQDVLPGILLKLMQDRLALGTLP